MILVNFIKDFLHAWVVCLSSTWYTTRIVIRDEFEKKQLGALFMVILLIPFLFIGCFVWFVILTFSYAFNASFALHHISGRSEYLRAIKRGDYDKGLYG